MTKYILSNGMELKIRVAEEKDSLEIVNMFKQIGSESDNLTFGMNDYYYDEEQERQFIRVMKDRKNSIFIVAILDNKIIGNLSFATMLRERLMHRGDMGIAILRDYWGIGVGSKLMDYLIKWAEFNGGIRKIELQVRQDNLRAVELYLKWGFTVEGKISRGMCVNNVFYDLYYMGKIIGG